MKTAVWEQERAGRNLAHARATQVAPVKAEAAVKVAAVNVGHVVQ